MQYYDFYEIYEVRFLFQVQIPKHLGLLLSPLKKKSALAESSSLQGSITSKNGHHISRLCHRWALDIEFKDIEYYVREGSRNKGQSSVHIYRIYVVIACFTDTSGLSLFLTVSRRYRCKLR